MKELVPMDDYGIFASKKYEALVDSRFVALVFEKEHKNVMQAIKNILEHSGFSEEFRRLNFKPSSYVNEQNKKQPCYIMTRNGFIALTIAIQSIHEEPKPHHYSNEMDMLNRIVLGMTAKQYREKFHIPANEPIRTHFSHEEANLMTLLQNFDIGFVVAVPDFQQRKQMLEYQAMKWREKHKTKLVSIAE